MNKWEGLGRPTRNPEVRYTQGENPIAVARYTLAVDRNFKNKEGKYDADFISCVAMGKAAEFAEKYIKQGKRIAVTGRLQTGSYTNKEGQKVYTTDVMVETQEFADGKDDNSQSSGSSSTPANASEQDFMNIPDDIDEELPFN